MKIKLQFSTDYRKEIENGTMTVETYGGTPVRIVCWDVEGESPILGLVPDVNMRDETPQLFYPNGKRFKVLESTQDLYCVKEVNLEHSLEVLYKEFPWEEFSGMGEGQIKQLCKKVADTFYMLGYSERERVAKINDDNRALFDPK